ncbi:MAG TPA: hypothetical protein VFH27_11990 [Longimicrobiaceae bacterium]|nr:hypothetical protein [Longimicrobiaceae bacterium]
MVLLALGLLLPPALAAQGGSEPMACPTKLNDRFQDLIGDIPWMYQGRQVSFYTPWTNDALWPWSTTAVYLPDLAPLVDRSGTVEWVSATLTVRCQKHYWVDRNGEPHWSSDYVVHAKGGTLRSTSIACGGGAGGGTGIDTHTDGGGINDNSYSGTGYDPYSSVGGNCGTGAGDGGDAGGGSDCHTEYIYVDVSYDGGATWQVWWEGYATVCE